jgi:hypothetical protein
MVELPAHVAVAYRDIFAFSLFVVEKEVFGNLWNALR